MTGPEVALLGACRASAMTLALAVTRAAGCVEGEQGPLVLADVAAGWWASLPSDVRTSFAMTGELAAGMGLLKAG